MMMIETDRLTKRYGDRTIKDTLALPVSRTSVVISKLVAVSLWNALLGILLFGTGLGSGVLLHLPGWRELPCRLSATSS